MSQRQDSAAPHAGHRQRVRARLLSEGPDAMAPHELLEFILFYAIPKRDVNPLAHRLIDRFGSLSGVLAADESELRAVDGMGAAAAGLIKRVHEAIEAAERERLVRELRAARRARGSRGAPRRATGRTSWWGRHSLSRKEISAKS